MTEVPGGAWPPGDPGWRPRPLTVQTDLGLGGPAPGGASDSTVPNSSDTPNNVDKYATCIERAKGDATKARKCADLLSG